MNEVKVGELVTLGWDVGVMPLPKVMGVGFEGGEEVGGDAGGWKGGRLTAFGLPPYREPLEIEASASHPIKGSLHAATVSDREFTPTNTAKRRQAGPPQWLDRPWTTNHTRQRV